MDGPGPGEVQHGPSLRGGIEAPGPRRPLASARPIDVRFLAPHPVGRVALVDVPAAVTAACEAAGLDVVTDRPELVVTSRRSARRAARLQGQSLVALGPARRALSAAGHAVETCVVRRGPLVPRLVVPLRPPAVADSVLLMPMTGHRGPKRIATRAVLSALRLGLPVGEVVTLGTRVPGLPALLAAATEVGLPPLATWHLRAGEGDDLQRLVWLCSAPGSTEPGWAVKTTRLRGYSTPFDRDAQGLALLTPTPTAVRGHAPTFLGSIEVDGVHGAVETAAAGLPLHNVLGGLDPAAHASPSSARSPDGPSTSRPPPPSLPPRSGRSSCGFARWCFPPGPATGSSTS